MRVLVIGSEGNIGRPLVSYLQTHGHAVTATDIRPGWRPGYVTADICMPMDLADAIDNADVVLLLSAVVSRVVCEQAALLTYSTNLQGAAGIARLCAKSKSKLVFLSTSEVYGPTTAAMSEDMTPHPNNRYGLTKWLGEEIVRYEVEYGNLDAVILRPFMIYGENEDEGEHRSAVVRFASNLAAGRPIFVHHGTMRSWMHVDDACRAIELACYLEGPGCPVINIGHPRVYPMVQVAEFIRAELGVSIDLLHYEQQPRQMTPVKRPDLARQAELLGIEPTIDLPEGIRRVCARYKK